VLVSRRRVALLERLAARPPVDRARLAALIAFTEPDDRGATVHRGVRCVPPWHRVVVAPTGAERLERLPEKSLSPLDLSPDDAADALWSTLRSAIRRGAAGARKVAVLAGGGVDSSGVLAATLAEMRGARQAEVTAIALDFAGPGDDRPYMRELAAELGIVPVRVAPSMAGRFVRAALVLDSAPYALADAGCSLAMLRAARDIGAERVITGAGGDDLLDGDPSCLADEARRGRVWSATRAAARLQVIAGTTAGGRIARYVVQPLVAPLVPAGVRGMRRRFRHRDTHAWAGPLLRDFLARAAERTRPPAPRDASGRLARFVSSSYLAEITELRSQLESASGVVRVDPFFDPEVVELVLRLPPHILLYGDRVRGLYRHALRGRVPDRVRLRPDKADFETALLEQLDAAGGFPALADLARMEALHDLGLVEPRAFAAAYDELARTALDTDQWILLWPALAAEAFARAWS